MTAALGTGSDRAVADGTYRRIWRFMGEFKAPLALGIGLSMITSVAFALLPWPVRYVIDGVLLDDHLEVGPVGPYATATDGQKVRAAIGLGVVYLGLQMIAALGASATFYVFARTALHMIHTLRGRMVTHLRRLSLGFHADQSTGDIIFRAIFQVLFMVVLMLLLDVWLTLAALAVAPLLVFTIRRLTARIQAASQASRGHMSRLTALIEQTMNSIRAVQVFGQEGDEAGRFDSASRAFIAAQLRFRLSEQALSVATMTITGLGTATVLLVATNRVIEGAVTVGSLWIFVNYMQRIYDVLQQNMNLYGLLQDSIVGVGRAFQVLDTEPDIVDAADAAQLAPLRTAIELRDVSLRYDAGGERVLDGVSLIIPKGHRVAIVGPTGAGKSSLLQLVPRLYDASDGAVLIDGVDVRNVTLASLRRQVSLVPQEPLLFATTIAENIRYGRRDATDEEVAAARAARAEEFIDRLPDGYQTDVGDRGVKLSVGQQQRVAIARAILKDAPILLLDEPTSALDSATEADFLRSLDELMEGRTVLIVAHRLSTVRRADAIIVLDRGRVVETGTHDELLARRGAYHALHG